MMRTLRALPWARLGITVIVIAILSVAYFFIRDHFFAIGSDEFYYWLDSLGIWAPLVMMLLMTTEVVLAPLPGGWLMIASGYLFGPWLGFVISYCAMILGSIIAFELAHYFGKPLVQKLVKPDRYAMYEQKIHSSQWAVFLLYAIPLFPVDIISLLLGLSGLRRKRFWMLMGLGFLPNTFVLNFVGNAITSPEYQLVLTIGVVIVVLYLLIRWLKHRATMPTN